MMRMATKRVLVGIAIFLIFAIGIFIGLRSGVRQDKLFHMAMDLKSSVSMSKDVENLTTNQYGQLISYHKKIKAQRPFLTDRSMVAFVFGQSNAANHGGEKYSPNNDHILNYWEGNFYLAADPLLGATGISGSVWTSVGKKILERGIADQVLLIAAGVGRTSVQDWGGTGRLNNMFESRLKDAQLHDLKINYFLWHQGESDNSLPPQQYLESLNQVIDLTKKYFPKSKFFVSQASVCGNLASSPKLLQAQKQATYREGVFSGPNTDLISLDDRYDECHFSARGIEQYAQGWVESIASSIASK
jgi:hypothetical protein